MKSTYEMIKRKAIESENGYYKFVVDDPTEVLYAFSIGTGDNYLSEKDEHGLTIEVWISTRVKLEDIPNMPDSNISVIREYDSIDDEDRDEWFGKTGYYDYHLEFIPSAFVADFFPSLYPVSISGSPETESNRPVAVNTETGEVVTFEKGSLAEFAVSHGCDYMDMSSMTLYRGL